MELVVLVDEHNNEIGTEEKMRAHELAKLHRAFSIFLYNSKDELLIQQRAESKYHCGGLWANTCCSHPRPGESYSEATQRRLGEELGFSVPSSRLLDFVYRAEFDNGLTEHEHDTIFVGQYESEVSPNPEEVQDYLWIKPATLRECIDANPASYTPWLRKAMTLIDDEEVRSILYRNYRL